MIYSSITGTGHCLPGKAISNSTVEKKLGLTQNWIESRTGVKQRFNANVNQCASDLGAKAAISAIKNANLTARNIDFVICSSSTPDLIAPSTASIIAHKIGLHDTPSFDLNSACSGWIYALHVADQFIRSGTYQHILIVSSEIMSRITHESDPYSYVVFGDGAGAIILSSHTKPGLLKAQLYSNAAYSKALYATNAIAQQTHNYDSPTLVMQGQEVYKQAVHCLTQSAQALLDNQNLSIQDIDWLIPHQANKRILITVARNLGIPVAKVIITVDEQANTSSASIPIALDIANKKNLLKPEQKILMIAFGSGYSWGGGIMTWQPSRPQ